MARDARSRRHQQWALPLAALGCGVVAMEASAFLAAPAPGGLVHVRGVATRPWYSPSVAGLHGAQDGMPSSVAAVCSVACVVAVLAGSNGLSGKVSPTRSRHVRKFFGGGDKESEAEMSDAAKAKCEELAAEVSGLQEEAEEKRAAHERLKMEVQNYRTRTRNELSAARGKAAIPIFNELLPIADEFELAQQNLKLESDGERKIAETFKDLFGKMLVSWKALGVEKMETLGEEFDPLLHEAISMIPSADYSADKVCNELRGGWQLKPVGTDEREVLRAALVCVSSGPGPS